MSCSRATPVCEATETNTDPHSDRPYNKTTHTQNEGMWVHVTNSLLSAWEPEESLAKVHHTAFLKSGVSYSKRLWSCFNAVTKEKFYFSHFEMKLWIRETAKRSLSLLHQGHYILYSYCLKQDFIMLRMLDIFIPGTYWQAFTNLNG